MNAMEQLQEYRRRQAVSHNKKYAKQSKTSSELIYKYRKDLRKKIMMRLQKRLNLKIKEWKMNIRKSNYFISNF
jgi:hypothetical protein